VGAEASRAFAAKEIFGDRVTFTPLRAMDRHGDITVHARTDGTYDKTVRAGENGGRTIPHRDIVRELMRIGRWSGTAETIALPAAANVDGLKSAVLVQAGPGGPILAAVRI
jgi:hypothetical protein